MIYRIRSYEVVPEHFEAFNDFFVDRLLPVQLRHGARLVGRWVTDDHRRVLAVWEYDDMSEYERINAAVQSDPDDVAAQQYRVDSMPPFFVSKEELFMESVVPAELTMLGRSV